MTIEPDSIPNLYASTASRRGGSVPEKFRKFMEEGWLDNEPVNVPVTVPESRKLRRMRVGEAFPSSLILLPAGTLRKRSNDCDYPFRPHSDFIYCTGYAECDAVLAMVPTQTGGHDHILLLRTRSTHTTDRFYTDSRHGELWTGHLPSFQDVEASIGMPVKAIETELPRLKRLFPEAIFEKGIDPKLDQVWQSNSELVLALSEHISNLRMVKDAHEISVLRRAVGATHLGFEKVVSLLRDGEVRTERDVEIAFDSEARRHGNSVGYQTIVAAAKHSTILHWSRNNGPLPSKSLVLLDAGVEDEEWYTADITRTLPIGGVFTQIQAEIYEIVLKAQTAAIAQIKPGAHYSEPHQAAMKVLTEGLVDLNILKCSVDEALLDEHQFFRRYSLHGTSHMLGLDVHDCSAASQSVYIDGRLMPGHVLTAEPGLYFQANDETVPSELRGIGIRIEDDILVTDEGNENLSEAMPKGLKEIERWLT